MKINEQDFQSEEQTTTTTTEKKLTANEKRREANIKRQRAKRQAKAKECEELYEKWEKGELEEDDNAGKYLPNVQVQKMTGNPAIGISLRNTMMFWKCEPVRTDDELAERLAWYFETCLETNQLPTFEKMCLACGYGKDWIYDILNGRSGGFSPLTSELLKKAQVLLASNDGELALQSKIQPVVYMFRAKNFYGMSDKQEIVQTKNDPLSGISTEELEEKYKQLPKK